MLVSCRRVKLMKHAFVDSGQRLAGSDGRLFKVCAECGRRNVGLVHSPAEKASPMPVAKTKPTIAREVRLLALALEGVLDLPMDTLGWSIFMRALDLRKAIPIPFDPQSRPLDETPKPRPTPIVVSELPVERLSGPVRARAKTATKGIRDKRMREIATRAVAQGWTLRATGGGHYQLWQGDKAIVFSGTPSDHRAWLNVKARAKRAGIDVSDL